MRLICRILWVVLASCATQGCINLDRTVFEGIPANTEKYEEVDGYQMLTIAKTEEMPWGNYLYRKSEGTVRNEKRVGAHMYYSSGFVTDVPINVGDEEGTASYVGIARYRAKIPKEADLGDSSGAITALKTRARK